jgi:hypothetical protein
VGASSVLSWSCGRDADAPTPSDASVEASQAVAPPPRVQTTAADFEVPGTPVGGVDPSTRLSAVVCSGCHGAGASENAPHETWRSSLMASSGRDPLFFAQLATASQDAPGVAGFCLRCHLPNTAISGHSAPPPAMNLDENDREGVTCMACHSLVDPAYDASTSPASDAWILASTARVPTGVGNAAFVLDPTPTRRGPYDDVTNPLHPLVYSPYVDKGELCGTCHEVGNPQVMRQPDGTYRYGALGQRAENDDPRQQFPLERTYSEWKLSAFARGGVDMKGRFGGPAQTIVDTCQSCHMPDTTDRGCVVANARPDLARHEFSGATAWALQAIFTQGSAPDEVGVQRGIDRALSMLRRAATLEGHVDGGALAVRVTNESGHKLPTGHIEGRRAWVSVDFYDAGGRVVARRGAYDPVTMTLDESSTTVFEMEVGLSDQAAKLTGLPAGRTRHMALADVIVKDTRIPPRGFDPAAYAEVGAPAVGASYATGQYWADLRFPLAAGAVKAHVALEYQTVTREYVEALRDGNVIDDSGAKLFELWNRTGNGAPIEITAIDVAIGP